MKNLLRKGDVLTNEDRASDNSCFARKTCGADETRVVNSVFSVYKIPHAADPSRSDEMNVGGDFRKASANVFLHFQGCISGGAIGETGVDLYAESAYFSVGVRLSRGFSCGRCGNRTQCCVSRGRL